MGVFEFVIGLVIIGTVSSVITGGMRIEREKIKARSRGYAGEAEELRGIIGEMHAELTKVKDRVRVLERLATDGDRNLAAEIERLRREEPSSRV